MPLEVKSGTRVNSSFICSRCGIAYSTWKGHFYSCFAEMWRGIKHLPICKQCTDELYELYLGECQNAKAAVRQMCRKLDLVWAEQLFDNAEVKETPHTVFVAYLNKINAVNRAGQCYDDTLREEGVLWRFTRLAKGIHLKYEETEESLNAGKDVVQKQYDNPISDEVVAFWGRGYMPDMYRDLEERKEFWMSRYESPDDLDQSHIGIIRQVCMLEVTINRDVAAGKPIDKNVNSLNTLLGSLGLKPVQQKGEDNDAALEQPLGVWLARYEKKRPLPEVDEELKDVNGLIKYITIWCKGHLAKMLGVRNSYSKLYEDEMERLRVEKPEYADEEDEEFLADFLSGGDVDDEV